MTKFTVLALLASVIAVPAFAAPLATGTVESKKETTLTTTAPVADTKVIDKKDAKIVDAKAVPAKPLTIAKAPVVSSTPAKIETKNEVKTETKEAK